MKNIVIPAMAAVLTIGCYAHEHHPPHKGTLVEFGEEFAHLELVLDAVTGKLTGYTLDGEAENPVRVKQLEIEIKMIKPAAGSVKLKAVASPLSGEKEGDTSEFEGQADQLKGIKDFDAQVSSITIKGKEFKDVKFNYPKGNEEPK